MDILIVNNFVLSAITLRKPLDESKAQPRRDGEAVFCFTSSPQRVVSYSYATWIYGGFRTRSRSCNTSCW